MPNMDDITFFESSLYEHRGGIWADACRQEQKSSLFTSSQAPADDARSTSSVPTEGAKSESSDLEPPNDLKRSQSTTDVPLDAGHSGVPSGTSSARPMEITPSSLSPGRRRTWFGASRDENEEGTVADEDGDQSFVRGRTTSTISRASSSARSRKSDNHENDSDEAQYLAPETRQRRASSTHSQPSSHKDNSPLTGGDGANDTEFDGSAARADTHQSNGSGRTTTGASSFLQTLRSKATDKQALSNTAKEAMRKWGVNWGNLRRDNTATGDEISDVDPQRLSDNRSRQRQSYAEVRAAVEQRSRHEPSQTEATEPQPSEPVAIPGHDRERSRSTSYVGESGLVARAKTMPTSRSVSPKPTVPSFQPGASAPNLPPRRTDSSTPSTSQEAPAAIIDNAEVPATPIHTQPPQISKTMTIPGIHASHRGEVMSMGYAPPTPPASSDQKKPAIQSVYRLWKNPNGGAAGQQPQVALSDSQAQTPIGVSGTDPDASTPTQPTTSDPPPRPTPPPLPPRTVSAYAKPESPKLPSAEADSSASLASAALQSIVAKDRTKRASLEPPARVAVSPTPPEDTEEPITSTSTSPSPSPSPSSSSTPVLSSSRGSPQPPALPPRRIRANA